MVQLGLASGTKTMHILQRDLQIRIGTESALASLHIADNQSSSLSNIQATMLAGLYSTMLSLIL